MLYGIIISAGDPATVADLAAEAEAAGWDAAFTYDAIAIEGMDSFDPWVTMAAMAMRTQRIRLGAIVLAPSRRRPWKLAREALSLDHLSNGRLIVAVGLGALDDQGFGRVGEATDVRTRAELLDESLAILDGLWSGEPFSFDGRHNRVDGMTMLPRPVQRPRIPIWVVGVWPRDRSMRRAVRWDGILPQRHDDAGANVRYTPDDIAAIRRYGEEHRPDGSAPWVVVSGGTTPGDDPSAAAAIVEPFRDAGADWWVEEDWSADLAALRARIRNGPPRRPAPVSDPSPAPAAGTGPR